MILSLRLPGPALPLALVLLAPFPSLASPNKPDEQAGAVLFAKQDCAHCHGPIGAGTLKGPDLRNLRKDKLWPPEKIANQILNGGKKMPPFSDSLTDREIAQLVAWLRAKRRPIPPATPPAQTPAQ